MSRKAFQDDPLRLLRAYRMMAQLDLAIRSENSGPLDQSRASPETGSGRPWPARGQVREELLKLLSQPQTTATLLEMDRVGLLTVIFPELEAGRRVGLAYYGKGGVVKHHLQSAANTEWLLDHLKSARAEIHSKSGPTCPRQKIEDLRPTARGGHSSDRFSEAWRSPSRCRQAGDRPGDQRTPALFRP